MKKLAVVLVVLVFGLFMLSSCNIEEVKEKYGIEQNNTKTGHDGVGDDDEEEPRETGGK